MTAAISQAALNAGANDVLLFTDLANATSKGVYQRLGFTPIGERVVLRFVAASDSLLTPGRRRGDGAAGG